MDIDIKTWKPEVLCLSSGSTKGIYMLGALFQAKQHGYLDNVHTYIGSSVGAILETLMICGWSIFEIFEHSCQTALLKDFSDIEWTQITKEYGLFPNSTFVDNLAKKLDWMVRHKFGRIPSLLDLYEITGKRMIFVVVSLKEERALYLDHINSPDLDVIRAMRMTSLIPGVFGKLEHQKDLFIDGAMIDPFPIKYLDDGKTPILGISVEDVRRWDLEKIGPGEYFDRIISLPLREMTNFAIANASDQCVIMSIPVKEELSISILDNGKNVDTKIKMFQSGYRFAENFFNTFDSTKLRKCKKEIPINSSVIKECLKSKNVEILLKCLKENPELLREEMSREDYSTLMSFSAERRNEAKPRFSNDIPEGIANSNLVVVKPQEVLPSEITEEDEIIEIPRSDFFSSHGFRGNVPEFPFPPFNSYGNTNTRFPSSAIVLKLEITNEMLEMFRHLGMMVLNDVMPRLQGSLGKDLRRL